MRVLLRDLAPGQEYAIQFRSNTGEEVSEWSHVQRFITTDDIIAPSQPTNLSWYASGTSFIGQWEKVTTQASSPVSPLRDFRHYRCNISDGLKSVDITVTNEYLSFSKDDNIAAFGIFKNALTLRVYCVDNSYNESQPAVSVVNPANPPVASAPVLKPYFGSLIAEWNGKDSSGGNMPINLDYLEVHVGTTSNFTPSTSTLQTRLYPNLSSVTQRALLSGLTNDTDYYARFVSVNLSNKKSNPSAVSNSARQTKISGLDIQPNGIGTDQINFTARDLGGANAFYGTTQPQVGVNGVTVIKSGDIWYDTNTGDNGGKTYRYDGSIWVEDTSIGVISGSKILANTLTADAVGTNFLLAANAKMNVAWIDSADINSLDAGLLTTGVVQSSFMVNYGGVSQPAFSFDLNGNAVLNNVAIKGQATVGSSTNTAAQNSAFAIRSYNYVQNSAGWTINGDGTVEFGAAILRGSFRTSSDPTVRRIELGTAGNVSKLLFTAPGGAQTWVRSVVWGVDEAIEFRGGPQSLVVGTQANGLGMWGWQIYNVMRDYYEIRASQGDDLANVPQYTRFRLDTTQNYIRDNNNTLRFFAGTIDTYLRDPNGKTRFYAGATDSYVRDGADIQRFYVGNDTTFINDFNGIQIFQSNAAGLWLRDASGQIKFGSWIGDQTNINGQAASQYIRLFANGNIDMNTGQTIRNFFWDGQTFFNFTAGGRITLANPGGASVNSSPRVLMYTSGGFGAGFKVWNDVNGTWIESRYWDDSNFAGMRAAAFQVNSDIAAKNTISNADTTTFMSSIKSTKVKKYKRNRPKNEPIIDIEEIGLIAQEAPAEIVGAGGKGIDLYQMSAMIWGAMQEADDRIEQLEKQIRDINGKGKK